MGAVGLIFWKIWPRFFFCDFLDDFFLRAWVYIKKYLFRIGLVLFLRKFCPVRTGPAAIFKKAGPDPNLPGRFRPVRFRENPNLLHFFLQKNGKKVVRKIGEIEKLNVELFYGGKNGSYKKTGKKIVDQKSDHDYFIIKMFLGYAESCSVL